LYRLHRRENGLPICAGHSEHGKRSQHGKLYSDTVTRIPGMVFFCCVTGPRFSGGNTALQKDKRVVGRSMWLDLTSGQQDVAGPTGRSLDPAIWHVAPLACLNWSALLPPLKRGPVTQQIRQLPCNVATVSGITCMLFAVAVSSPRPGRWICSPPRKRWVPGAQVIQPRQGRHSGRTQ
jgi:hypothetical protein